MRIGAMQMRLSVDLETNLNTIEHWLGKAADHGVEILNFPETCLTGYLFDAFLNVKRDDVTSSMEYLARQSQEKGVGIIVGTPYWENKRCFNSVAVLLADGRRYVYHKINLVPYEQDYFVPGSEAVTFKINQVTFGILDIFNRSLNRGCQGCHVSAETCVIGNGSDCPTGRMAHDDYQRRMQVSNCVFNLVPSKRGAFEETYRILKPGAHFSIADVVVQGEIPPQLREQAELYVGCVSGAIDKEEYLGIVREAGFENVKIVKEREITLTQELLDAYLNDEEKALLESSKIGIYSITVNATKPQ